MDSNHRSETQQIYSLPPLATRELLRIKLYGAGGRIRTPDLLITNQLLYRLSYTSTWLLSTNSERYYSKGLEVCQVKNEIFLLPPLRDFQAQRPVWICSRCGGEQYRYDRGESEHGRPLCSLCRSYLKERRDDHDIS